VQTPGLNHISLTVSNTERSRAFYGDLLGFPVTIIEEDPGKSFFFTCGGVQFFFFPSRQPIPNDRFNEFRIGLDHLSFTAPSKEALQELADILTAARVNTKVLSSSFTRAIGTWRFGIQITFNWNTGYSDRRI